MKGSKWSRLVDRVAIETEPGLSSAQLMLANYDLKPVEKERRQWGSWNFVGFWIADSFNINTWMISSSMIIGTGDGGLSWWQSWICVWVGYTIAACFICTTGRIGAVYHIPFPVVGRSSFGIWGSLWPVFNRAAMAAVWYGVQSWIGGTCVYLMLRSIWPSFEHVPNSLPASSGTNTRDFVSFFLFWFCSLPAIWFPVHKIRHLFTVKAYFVPCAGMAFFIWAIVKAHGIGPIVHQGSTYTSKTNLAWGVISGIMSSIANFATLIVNDPDFSRFARKPRDALWSQLITIPVGFAVTSFIGIIVSSSSTVIYGEPIWSPLELLSKFLDEGGSGTRAGVFFIATAFALAQLGTNIAANSVSCGTDMTALLPRFINIRRGGYICAAIGLAMCPWNLLSSTNNFTTYLSAYSVFLSSIAGVIICDYYFVRRGYLQVPDLYSARKSGPYYYTLGIHWRGYAAYIAGIIYNFNFFAGLIVSSSVYYLLYRFFPVPATSTVWREVGDDENLHIAHDKEYDEASTGNDIEKDDDSEIRKLEREPGNVA